MILFPEGSATARSRCGLFGLPPPRITRSTGAPPILASMPESNRLAANNGWIDLTLLNGPAGGGLAMSGNGNVGISCVVNEVLKPTVNVAVLLAEPPEPVQLRA